MYVNLIKYSFYKTCENSCTKRFFLSDFNENDDVLDEKADRHH